jgi:acyl carrier protein
MTADLTSTAERLRSMLATRLAIDAPASGADPIADGGLDSLMLMEILYEVELEFGIRVDFASFDPARLRTLDGIAAWVEEDRTAPRRAP